LRKGLTSLFALLKIFKGGVLRLWGDASSIVVSGSIALASGSITLVAGGNGVIGTLLCLISDLGVAITYCLGFCDFSFTTPDCTWLLILTSCPGHKGVNGLAL